MRNMSTIEWFIVAAIVGIVLAIAIPNIMALMSEKAGDFPPTVTVGKWTERSIDHELGVACYKYTRAISCVVISKELLAEVQP